MKQIKQIQLRGISRNPSDRMTADGGVAESLNFQLDEQESAPALAPRLIRDVIPYEFSGDVLYIHKSATYKNYICRDGRNVVAYEDGTMKQITRLDEGENISSVTSVGNTIVICTNKNTRYALYKGGRYVDLGPNIPFPELSFAMLDQSGKVEAKDADKDDPYSADVMCSVNTRACELSTEDAYLPLGTEPSDSGWHSYAHYTTESIIMSSGTPASDLKKYMKIKNFFDLEAVNTYYNTERNEIPSQTQSIIDYVKDKISIQDRKNSEQGIHAYPHWILYGVRLYDGTVICSSPVLINAGASSPYIIDVSALYAFHYMGSGSNMNKHATTAFVAQIERTIAGKLYAKLGTLPDRWDDWKDIIMSVDVYMSEPIGMIGDKRAKVDIKKEFFTSDKDAVVETTTRVEFNYAYFGLSFGKRDKQEADEYLEKSNFYLVKRYDFENLPAFADTGYKWIDTCNKTMSDQLTLLERLTQFDWKNYPLKFDKALSLNKRVLGYGVSKTIDIKQNYPGAIAFIDETIGLLHKECPRKLSEAEAYGLVIYKDNPTYFYRTLVSHLHESTWDYPNITLPFIDLTAPGFLEMTYKVQADKTIITKSTIITPDEVIVEGVKETIAYYDVIVCPESRATEVFLVGRSEGLSPQFGHKMLKPSTFADFSVYFGSIKNLLALSYVREEDIPEETNKIEEVPNYVYLSSSENPFYFPVSGRYFFESDVVAVAPAIEPMSQGQFGFVDMYVFTSDGIRVMKMNDTGSFSENHQASRQVAIGDGNIVSLNKAVIFATTRGIEMISGLETKFISENMVGDPYNIEAKPKEILAPLFRELNFDNGYFYDFIKESSGIYDYSGDRVIFLNPKKNYAYVYVIKSNTWHKCIIPPTLRFKNVLNSYPAAEIVFESTIGDTIRIYDYSTFISEINLANITESLIATRSIDLGLPDTYKSISEIKIRGNYEREGNDEHMFCVSFESENPSDLQEVHDIMEDYDINMTIDNVKAFLHKEIDVNVSHLNDVQTSHLMEELNEFGVVVSFAPKKYRKVQYILLGSNDGHNFTMLHSLRGQSWKMFRIIVVAKLKPNERISWIDVEYEQRFTNRIR